MTSLSLSFILEKEVYKPVVEAGDGVGLPKLLFTL